MFPLPGGITESQAGVECGYLTVPELHSQPGGKQIKLAVAIIKSTSPNPTADPLVMAQGGPGGSTLDLFGPLLLTNLYPLGNILRADRDIVLFDQRGTLYSQPSLVCQEEFKLVEDTIEQRLSPEESLALSKQAAASCRDRLVSEGVNLAAYNSLENAADIEDLRKALGYERINLYGVSYGTLLALHTMRDFPGALRSVILDSTVPTQINPNLESAASFQRSLNELAAACAADPGCNVAYPNLEGVFFELVDSLNQSPVNVPIVDKESGKTYNAMLDGDTLMSLMFQLLYSTEVIPALPKMIYDLRDGQYTLLERYWPLFAFDHTQSSGMYYSVMCAEDVDFTREDMDVENVNPEIVREQLQGVDGLLQVCSLWGAPYLGPSLDTPVKSDIPTLILGGQFDPITPPTYAQVAAQSLSNSHVFIFPADGHGALFNGECAPSLVREFLNNPLQAPQNTCFSKQASPQFINPSNTLMTSGMERGMSAFQNLDGNILLPFSLALLGLLVMVMLWPLIWLIGKLTARPAEQRWPARLAPWLAALVAFAGLIFVVGLFAIVLNGSLRENAVTYFFGIPRSGGVIFLLPPLVGVVSTGMLVLAVIAWIKGYWGVFGRLYYTLATVLALGFSFGLAWLGFMFGFVGLLF